MTSHYERTFEQRCTDSGKSMKRWPDRACIYLEKSSTSLSIPEVDKNKYLVPKDLTIGQFMYVVRKRINLEPNEALFFMINQNIVNTTLTINEVYERYKDPDGFLYIKYCGENCFGA